MSKCLIPVLALLAGCHVSFGSANIKVDGVELEERHLETHELDLSAGFSVSSAQGNLVIEHAVGGSELVVELFEKTPGDAQAVFEDGKLTSRTSSGEPSAIGDVTLRTNRELSSLTLELGIGDCTVRGVGVTGRLSVELGMGDCHIESAGQPDSIDLESGMGDLVIEKQRTQKVTVGSGMGDILLSEVSAARAKLETGMGDVDVKGSTFEHLTAETGMGSIDCRGSNYDTRDLSTGMGRVRED